MHLRLSHVVHAECSGKRLSGDMPLAISWGALPMCKGARLSDCRRARRWDALTGAEHYRVCICLLCPRSADHQKLLGFHMHRLGLEPSHANPGYWDHAHRPTGIISTPIPYTLYTTTAALSSFIGQHGTEAQKASDSSKMKRKTRRRAGMPGPARPNMHHNTVTMQDGQAPSHVYNWACSWLVG
jgi:hypothetical protein